MADQEAPDVKAAVTLVHVFSTFAVGGPQRRFARIAEALGGRYRNLLVAMDGRFEARDLVGPRAALQVLDVPIHKGRTVTNLLNFRRALGAVRADTLITYNWGAIEWALANRLGPGARHVHVEDGFGPEEATGQLRRRVLVRRLALKRAAEIVVPSLTLRRIALTQWGFAADKVRHVPNGIACAKFQVAPDPAAVPGFRPAAGEVVVGTVAALRPEKNLARLVRAFHPVAGGARLLIVGDGAERARLEGLAGDLGIADRVHFAGHVAQPEKVYGMMDIYALSSDTEQMPIGLLEAMAAGLAVAAPAVGDVKDIVASPNRPLIAAAGDEAGLARSLARLIEDPALRRHLGNANRRRVEAEFDEATMFQAYDRIYRG